MSVLLSLLLWLASSPAQALTSRQSGPAFDLAAGLGMARAEGSLRPGLGAQLGLGWWAGKYDDQYAIGRYWQIGVNGRLDWARDSLYLAPMLELRRGIEIIVAGVAVGVGGGPLLLSRDTGLTIGGTGRASVTAKLRRTRHVGLTLRIEGGVNVAQGIVSPSAGALLGIAFARPGRGEEAR